jgi:hypothetical protein
MVKEDGDDMDDQIFNYNVASQLDKLRVELEEPI